MRFLSSSELLATQAVKDAVEKHPRIKSLATTFDEIHHSVEKNQNASPQEKNKKRVAKAKLEQAMANLVVSA